MVLFSAIGLQDSWPLLAPVVLGFAAVYLLMPKVPRTLPLLGMAFAGLALVLCGWYAADVEGFIVEKVLFYIFAGIAILGGGMLITLKNPVYAALSFALVVLSTCGLFLLQAAPFLMAATVIIYAGAIVVTFLFVIMLAQQAGVAEADQRSREPFLASLAGFVLVGAIVCVVHKNYNTRELDNLLSQVKQLAQAKNADEVIAIMGDPARRPGESRRHPLVDGLNNYLPNENAVLNMDVDWQKIRSPNNLANLLNNSRLILALANERRITQGSLFPSAKLPLSALSGQPANVPIVLNSDGQFEERLPRQNVAALGTSLFTDYLLPVELAAVLLLVATCGAIAIAGRRAEGLR